MISPMTRAFGLTATLFALVVALTIFMALTPGAGAAPISTYPANTTPEAFEQACHKAGGQTLEITGPDGTLLASECVHGDGTVSSSCDWIKKTCTDYNLEPGSDGGVGGPIDGELLDDTSAPSRPTFGDVAAPSPGDVFDRTP